MPFSSFPEETKKFELQAFKRPGDLKELIKNQVAFAGSPMKHPYDSEKVVLVPDPYSGCTFYFEFKTVDISYMEELPSIVNIDGETISMVRLWIKKTSLGVRCIPFLVEDLRQGT